MSTLHIYVTCGVWKFYENKEWGFIVDGEKRGRLLTLQSTTSLEELKLMVSEDYGMEESVVDVELSYLAIDISVDSPPVVMMNDRQLKNFTAYWKRNYTIRLCVTFKSRVDERSSRNQFDLNKEPSDDAKEQCDDAKERCDDAKERCDDAKERWNDGNRRSKSVVFKNADKLSDDDAKVVDGVGSTLVELMVKKGELFQK